MSIPELKNKKQNYQCYVGLRTAREAERELPEDLPEKELSRDWLKAPHRAVDSQRSEPWKPWHQLTREDQKPVTPGEIVEYQIDILPNANLFRRGAPHLILPI